MRLPLKRGEFLGLAGALAVIGMLLTLLFHWQPATVAALASAVSDTYYRFNHRQPSRDIVFIAVDHAAVKHFGRWPWPRRHSPSTCKATAARAAWRPRTRCPLSKKPCAWAWTRWSSTWA